MLIKENDTHKSYPIQFAGYAGNTMDAHFENEIKNDRATNPTSSNLLGNTPAPNIEINT